MLKLIIHVSTRNKHAMKFKTSRKLNANFKNTVYCLLRFCYASVKIHGTILVHMY